MIKFICHYCGKEGSHYPSQKRKFCSHKCSELGYSMSREKIDLARQRRIIWNKEHPCSYEHGLKCYRKTLYKRLWDRENHPRWNGGFKFDQDGYRSIRIAPRKYVREHRFIMEQFLGRKLSQKEHVHHIDGDKLNNSIENLRLFKSAKEHTQYHWTTNWEGRKVKHSSKA
jgi:hypothetical protein